MVPNGCFDADEEKVNEDISKHQEEVKLIFQFQRFKKELLDDCKNTSKYMHPLGM